MRSVSFRTTKGDKTACDKLAKSLGVSVSEIIRESIDTFLSPTTENLKHEIGTTAWLERKQYNDLQIMSEVLKISKSKLIHICLKQYVSSKSDN